MSGCCVSEEERIENLISLAIVIGVGCKPCTKFYIDKALKEGCSKEDLKKVISIAESLEKSECLRKAVREENADRMKEPLKIAKELLEAK